MLYRYPIEQKKTAHEIIVDNNRYDRYTHEELPPLPYVNRKAAANNTGKSGKNSNGASGAAKAVQSVSGLADQQKALLLAQKRAAVENQYSSGKKALKSNYEAQMQAAQMTSDEIMRQLYIAYMQGIKNMSQYQALQGAGGEIESIRNRHRTNYENNRAVQNNSYNSIISEIQQKYNSDLMELEEKYIKQLMNL